MSDTDTIRGFVAPWTRAGVDRDWDALLDLCTDDVAFSPPGEPQVSGGDVRPWLETFPVIKAFDWDFDDIQISGDLATGSGAGIMTVEMDGEDVALNLKFVDIFRRMDDGSWRFAHIIWNLNEAAS
jgi:ketosteroid isomerase-like protein